MSGAIRIRAARPADADRIVAFNRAMAAETEARHLDPEILAAGVAAVLADPARGRYLVAEDARGVIGQLMVTWEWSDWRNASFWWIQSVYVTPEARRQGVLRRLFAEIGRQARADPACCGLRLYVEAGNAAARAAYERLGLVPTRYRMMELELSGT